MQTIVLALLLASPSSALALTPDAPSGVYVEARSASVYAGACHYGAEYTTQGRDAVLAFRFEGGAHDGVALAGTGLVCLLSADRNLAEPGAARSSVVLLDAAAPPAARAAALAWLRATHGERLGSLRAVRSVALSIVAPDVAPAPAGSGVDERYAVSAGDAVRLTGNLLPERQCCKMPYDRWYAPLVPLEDALVGHTEALLLDEPLLGLRWRRTDENDAFVARFGASAVPGAVATR